MIDISNKVHIPFTIKHVKDRDLVIQMLKHESEIICSDWGQERYRDPDGRSTVSLDNEHAFNRKTLSDFGFQTDPQSVKCYREIFRTYFRGPDDYDREVINSSHYMRNNRCVFYKKQPFMPGDTLPDCRLYKIDGNTETSLYDAMGSSHSVANQALVCAFSNS